MRWQFYSKSVHSAHNSAIYANTHQTDECRANTFLMLFVLSERWWSCSTLICPMFNVGVGGDRLKRNDTLKDEKEMPFFTRQRFMDLNICWMCSRFDQKRKKKKRILIQAHSMPPNETVHEAFRPHSPTRSLMCLWCDRTKLCRSNTRKPIDANDCAFVA